MDPQPGVRRPLEVIPPELAGAVEDLPHWFVIGGQAVRCICPYRPSRDVDLGVETVEDLDDFLRRLESRGEVEVREINRNQYVLVHERAPPFAAE